ncbi:MULTISPECIES: hypothetical protein [Pseudomonadota]|uniref:hypothetical protein n=1 Tax=Pseudomonadota TaxID=1224 RepID=UPI003263E187
MQVLINKLDRSTLDEQERHAIEAFEVQLREINQLKNAGARNKTGAEQGMKKPAYRAGLIF